ncbi:MAG: class I SAM-dependent methyltransferase [Phycisphaerae bacterium]|nr:class I SAM-dependent methyltransferase [Phycisphaerae bacterium]
MVYRNKLDWIGSYVTGKSVLDLGCVCHDLDQAAVPWLHGFIRERAEFVLGVDFLESEVARMRADGYNVVAADVCKMELPGQPKFDVIVAGDILEHLDDFAGFFARVRQHLAPGGVFLVTTPNPVTHLRYLRVLLKGAAGANREHTCWFTAKVLRQLAERNGLAATDEAYVDDSRLFYPWFKPLKKGSSVRRFFRHTGRFFSMLLIWKPALLVQSIFCRIRPKLSETICMAFTAKQ